MADDTQPPDLPCIICEGKGCHSCGNTGRVSVLDVPIPEGVSKLFDSDGGAALVTDTRYSFCIRCRGLELRFVEEPDGTWCFDEVVGPCWIHIEQMDDNYYWIGLSSMEDRRDRVCVNIGAARAPVRMTGWAD